MAADAPRIRKGEKVALALGAGGARGLAQVGVIEALCARGMEIVAISGSSSGALVGGIHAAGKLGEFREHVERLGRGDFLRLLTVQLRQQDPLAPVDNKDMLAQLAQFSALAGSTTANARLGEISDKLDALIAAQQRSAPTTPSTAS